MQIKKKKDTSTKPVLFRAQECNITKRNVLQAIVLLRNIKFQTFTCSVYSLLQYISHQFSASQDMQQELQNFKHFACVSGGFIVWIVYTRAILCCLSLARQSNEKVAFSEYTVYSRLGHKICHRNKVFSAATMY